MRALLISVSFLANVGLTSLLIWRPELAPAPIADFLRSHGVGSGNSRTAPVLAEARHAKPPLLWQLLQTDDLKTLVSRLRAAGFPPGIVRRVVQARVARQFRDRYRALEDFNAPYWKPRPVWSPERQAQYAALARERSRIERELFNDPWFGAESSSPEDRRMYGNLPPAKIEQLRRIEDDYAEMMEQVRAAAKNVLLDADKAQLALLREQKQADLAATLSPDELADYQLRSSPFTRQIAQQLGDFEPSDSEFRALYRAYQKLSDKYVDANFGSFDASELAAGGAGFTADLKSGLGELRAGEYVRDINPEYQQLQRIVQDAGLAPSVAANVFQLRNEAAEESHRIADDPTLGRADKVTALNKLSDNTRLQLTAQLGSAVPQFMNTANQWLTPLEHGNWVSFPPRLTFVNGSGSSVQFMGAPERHPLPPPPKATGP